MPLAPVRRYLLWMRYDGSRFPEMAKGGSKFGVLDLTDAALSTTFPEFNIGPSSRTDAGVHALRSAVLVNVPEASMLKNDLCMVDIRQKYLNKWNAIIKEANDGMELLDIHPVSRGFCARKSIAYRRYVYRLAVVRSTDLWERLREKPSPICFSERNYCWRLPPGFDHRNAQQACNLFHGTHNMASFFKHSKRERRKDIETPTTTRTIFMVSVDQGGPYSIDNDIYDYYNVTIVSPAYLREQIRRMMALIVGSGYGNVPNDMIPWLLNNPHPHNFFERGLHIAPPQGLFLADVVYDRRMFENPVPSYVQGWDLASFDEVDSDYN
ncbi:hypothetical protein L596_005156 [Steinernema carpocapsae]|uniref:tRNA pseudouridine synthase n=1 Tax=Steinernema carpocapsae TaxID=34508 RepID=A0A4U8V1Q1_STECR|nr:hypothetical protein L596_005156 [Steinernema carpocapsae]